jgi:hypothetical protein
MTYVTIVANTKKLGTATPNDLQRRLESIMETAAQRTVAKLRIYPTATAPSGYRRTGRLRDEWRYYRSTAGGSISFVVVNDAKDTGYGKYRRKQVKSYATFVQGNRQTGAAADIGWKTASQLLDRERIAKDIQAEITRYLRGA